VRRHKSNQGSLTLGLIVAVSHDTILKLLEWESHIVRDYLPETTILGVRHLLQDGITLESPCGYVASEMCFARHNGDVWEGIMLF
jgi:hypothetical protein